MVIRDPEQVEIKIPPSFADFINQGTFLKIDDPYSSSSCITPGSVGSDDLPPAYTVADHGDAEPVSLEIENNILKRST